jgi:hypothetical protein
VRPAGSQSKARLVVAAACTHNQVAHEDLENLGLQTRPSAEYLLQDGDQDVAERRADEGAVDGHLGHARGEVVALPVLVVRNPRGQKLLEAGERSGGKHLGAQRVVLQLLEIGLRRAIESVQVVVVIVVAQQLRNTYREVAVRDTALGHRFADLAHEVGLAFASEHVGGCFLGALGHHDRLLLELDRHGWTPHSGTSRRRGPVVTVREM